MAKQNLVLLCGGSSEERLVSVASAQNLANQFEFGEIWFIHQSGALSLVPHSELLAHADAFQKQFHPTAAPFAKEIKETFGRLKDKQVFIALHGTEGEDGALQALFENAKIAFTGSGSTSSRQAFEKDQAKAIVAKKGITIAPQLIVQGEQNTEALTQFFQLHHKIVLKPLANGSSIGLHIIHDASSLQKALQALSAQKYGPYLAEKFIEGRELTVGVFHDGKNLCVLPPSEVVLTKGHSFDYQGKYLGRGTTEVTPAEISAAQTADVQRIAKLAHEALGCYGYSRTDLMLTPNGAVFLETNTLPGLTKASFVPQQLAAANIDFKTFVESQLALASRR
jgi:D-alanine-D-alanine ligase